MRNPELDQRIDLDDKISELQTDERGTYRMVNDKKIYQIEEKTQHDKDMNLIINRYRASGMSMKEYLSR